MDEILRVQSLTKRYGPILALDQVDLSLRSGGVTCLVGPNGAGKTTLIETILGLVQPDAGEVFLFGERVRGRLPLSLSRRIGTTLENTGLHPWIPVTNSLRMMAELYEVSVDEEKLREALAAVGLEAEIGRQLYGKLSFGQKRKVELAAALMNSPEVLLLDDPFLGLDPLARMEMLDTLRQAQAGRTLLYSTHFLDIATRFSDRILVILKGQIRTVGTAGELIQRYGGKWRVRVSLPLDSELPGFEPRGPRHYSAEAGSLAELLGLLYVLVELPQVEDLHVEPPTLQQVFEKLVQEEKS